MFILTLLFIQQNFKLIFICLNKVDAFIKLYTIYIWSLSSNIFMKKLLNILNSFIEMLVKKKSKNLLIFLVVHA